MTNDKCYVNYKPIIMQIVNSFDPFMSGIIER